MPTQHHKPLWLSNCWYQAAWQDDLAEGVCLARTILDTPLVFFRGRDGAPRALLDRCPHRFAPLSAGSVADGVIRCGYHGLAFDGSGRCVHNPHGAATSAMRTQTFPVIEKHTALWVWLGDADADPALVPDLSFIDEALPSSRISGYMPTRCNYQLLSDNILDLSHADYLHPNSLGGMMTQSKTSHRETGDEIFVQWIAENCRQPPAFYAMVPPPSRADISISVKWKAPAVMILGNGAKKTGEPAIPENHALTLHNMTPETTTSSHYFFCSTRRFQPDNVQLTEMLREVITRAFEEEDKPMLERQQARMITPDLWSLKPVLLSIDTAAVKARRALDRLIEKEALARESVQTASARLPAT